MVHIDYCGTFKSYSSRLIQHRYSFHWHLGLRDLSHAPHIPNLHDTNLMKKKMKYTVPNWRDRSSCVLLGDGGIFSSY